jgi:hypothetical protein
MRVRPRLLPALEFLAVCGACWLLAGAPVRAEDASVQRAFSAVPPAPSEELTLRLEPGFLPAIAAIGPGFITPGIGAFLAHDRRAARNLAMLRGSAFGTMLAAGSLIAVTGTSRRLIGTLTPFGVMGAGVFLVGWLADIYAATTGGRDARAASWSSQLEAELGYRYVHDPQFAYRNFSYARVDLRGGRFRLSPSAWLALDENNQRVSADIAFRILGQTPRRPGPDGSYLDVATALTWHNYHRERFAVYTNEWRVDGRLDLVRLGPSLSGAFAEGQLGAALEIYDFTATGEPTLEDSTGMLLARFGFGVYFGEPRARSGEVLLYYDHRHDDFAAGLGVAGVGSGVLGHVGLSGHYFITSSWGVSLLAEVGSAYIGGANLRYRFTPTAREAR